MKISLRFMFIFLVVSLFQSPVTAQAQVEAQSCSYADIVDLTGTLDQGRICQAAKRLADSGYSVFVYFTHERFPYEVGVDPFTLGQVIESSEWEARVNAAESDAGLRSASGPVESLLAFEVAERPVLRVISGSDKLQPEALAVVAVTLDANLDEDPTSAFVLALNQAADINRQVGGVIEQPPPTRVPQPTVPPATPSPPFFSTPTGRNVGNTILIVAAIVFGLVILIALYNLAFVPWLAKRRKANHEKELVRRRMAGYKTQARDLRTILADLDARFEELFHGMTPEDTAIYEFWKIQGGHKYRTDEQVRQIILRARRAHEIVAKDNYLANLLNTPDPQDEQELIRYVTKLEELYVLFVGTTAEALNMTSAQLEEEFNPLAVSDVKMLDDKLVQQARSLRNKWSEDSINLTLMFADTSNVDELGILGNVSEVKGLLEDLVRQNLKN